MVHRRISGKVSEILQWIEQMISTHIQYDSHIMVRPSKMDLPILELIYFAASNPYPYELIRMYLICSICSQAFWRSSLGHQRWMPILSLWAWKRWRCDFFWAEVWQPNQLDLHACNQIYQINTLQGKLTYPVFKFSRHFWVDDFPFFPRVGYVNSLGGYWELYIFTIKPV